MITFTVLFKCSAVAGGAKGEGRGRGKATQIQKCKTIDAEFDSQCIYCG